jgi:hypothetical protein
MATNKSLLDESFQNPKIPLRGNILTRQELKSLTPKCDAKCAIFFNVFLFIVFALLGLPIIYFSLNVVEYQIDYTNCEKDRHGYCNIKFTTNLTIGSPVYFYYEIHNFYMNHRDFVKSRSFAQLKGDVHVDSSNNSKCEGAVYINEIFDNDSSKYYTKWGKSLEPTDYANPCGLIAKSFFNDTEYTLTNYKGENFLIDDSDIANDYDRKYMFKRNVEYKKLQWLDVEDRIIINFIFRTFYCMDANGKFPKFQKALGEDCSRITCWRI